MKYTTIFFLSLLCISCATTRSNIPSGHEDACSGITDDSVDAREMAALHCKDKHVLFDVAKFDTESSVRIVATKRLMDIKMVIKLYKYVKTDDSLSKAQRKKFREYLKKKFELLSECPGVGYTDAEKRKKTLYKCNSNLLKVFVARHDFDDEVRLYAVGKITSIEKLKGLWPYIRDDETLSDEIKKRFQERMLALAKTLADMNRRPSGELATERHYSGGGNTSLYDENGELKERKAQSSKKKEITDAIDDANQNLPKQLLQVINSSAAPKYCFEQALKRNPSSGGRIVVRVEFVVGGNVKFAKVVEDEIGSPEMNECVVKAIKRMNFPLTTAADTYTFPLLFTPTF